MSGFVNNQSNSNTPPEPDPTSSEILGSNPLPGDPEPASPILGETPLPRFNEPEEADPDEVEGAFRVSTATSPNLSEFLAGQRGEDTAEPEPNPAKPVFKISPAEPDWSNYTLSPLEDTASAEPAASGWRTAWAVVREVGETILLTLIIFFLIQTVIRNFRVVGTSMVDNLHDGQYLIIDKLSYTKFIWETFGIGGPKRGDVIVFEPPNRPGEDYVKRIIGLPGEKVEIRNGQVSINGERLAEPFQPVPGTYTMPNPVIVPEGQVFVLGDNRNNSNDSHNWGTLPMENIVGRAWLSYWPPSEWGVIPRDAPTDDATLAHFLDGLVPGANANSEK